MRSIFLRGFLWFGYQLYIDTKYYFSWSVHPSVRLHQLDLESVAWFQSFWTKNNFKIFRILSLAMMLCDAVILDPLAIVGCLEEKKLESGPITQVPEPL